MPPEKEKFGRRSYLKLAGVSLGTIATGAGCAVAQTDSGGYGEGGYGEGGYGVLVTEDPVSVRTGDATQVTETSAVLTAEVENIGSASAVAVSFEWGPSGSSLSNTTPAQQFTSTGSVSTTIQGLQSETEYSFRAVATGDNGQSDTGTTRQFTTSGTTATTRTLLPEEGQIVNAKFQTEHAGYTGEGYVNFSKRDSYVEWNVSSATQATYELTVRYALAANDRTGVLAAAGSQSDLTMSSTGGWDSWGTVTETVQLPAGSSVLRVAANGEDFGNLDVVQLEQIDTAEEPTESAESATTLNPRDGELVNAWFDSAHPGYSGDGYVNFRDSDSYVEWALDTDTSSQYDVTIRYALGYGERTGALSVADTTRSITVGTTGGWNSWKTTTERVSIPSGASSLRIEATGEDFANVDRVVLEPAESTTTENTDTEEATPDWSSRQLGAGDGNLLNASLESEHSGYNGDGFINFSDANSSVEWTVTTDTAGEFDIDIRYALGSSSRTGQLVVGDSQQEVTVDSTGGWDVWQTTTESISLPSGTSTIRIEATGEDFGNVDLVELQRR